MKRQLRKSGHGLVLYIEKPLQQLLGLEVGTIVTVETDGRRIMIEPTGETNEAPKKMAELEPWNDPRFRRWSQADNEEDAKMAYDAEETWAELHELGFCDSLFRRVQEIFIFKRYKDRVWDCWHHYREVLGHPYHLVCGDAASFATMRRLQLCLALRKEGLDWDAVIERALAAIPFHGDPSPAPEQTVLPPGSSSAADEVRSIYRDE